jgi:ribosomal protein L37AE/L43A
MKEIIKMETTVCPWCHTEIVWDEEFGPEENCPHCNNELNGYRTVTVGIDGIEEEEEKVVEEPKQEVINDDDLWGDVDKDSVVPIYNTLNQFGDDYDLNKYEERVSGILAIQEEAPECTQCHELTILAGKQLVSNFEPSAPATLGGPVLTSPFSLNVYVCPSCFHVQHSLAQEDRIQLVRNLSTDKA